MERWQMNRLGFVNFWLYDDDVFPLKDGKILLRGANASGKSITTQSFIPYILDGNGQPSRLDPFGGKDRKMSWYLLGDPENGKEESTAYLYLEFVKPESKKYRTIGIGLNAKKGNQMKMWGFCLKDGRRVGFDFPLYREAGGKNIPHNALTLKKQLGNTNRFVEHSEYKEMVAEEIFGIKKERISDYDQLTNILIKTRSSKLSKDNLKPTQLYSILNESLQTLSDDDLRPMADAMNKIEETHNRIEDAENALSEIHYISEEYDKYNRYVLCRKAEMYLDKSNEVQVCSGKLEEIQAKISDNEEEKQRSECFKEQDETNIKDLEREKSGLDIRDLNEHLERLENAKKQLNEAKDNQKLKKDSFDKINDKLKKLRNEYDEVSDDISGLHYDKSVKIKEYNDYEAYSFPLYEQYFGDIKEQKIQSRGDQCRKEKSELIKRLNKILDKLRELDTRRNERETAAETLGICEEKLHNAKNDFINIQNEFDDEKDRVIEAYYYVSHSNTEYIIDESLLEKIEKSIASYEGQGSGQSINALLSNLKASLFVKLKERQLQAEQSRSEAKKKYDELSKELEDLKNAAEPVLERIPERQRSREVLAENGILFRAFYECIDFNDEVSSAERAVIETELYELGLLDALIISERHKDKSIDLIGELSDSYISVPSEIKEYDDHFFKITAPDELAQEVKEIISRFHSCVSVDTNGFYQNGILAGHSICNGDARFIGSESRKKYRQQQIDELIKRVNEAEIDFISKEAEYIASSGRLEKLNEEYISLPSLEDLNSLLDMLLNARSKLDNAEMNYNTADEKFRKIDILFNASSAEVNGLCSEFPQYEKTIDFYISMIEIVNDFYDVLFGIIDILNKIDSKNLHLRSIEEIIEDKEFEKDGVDLDLKKIQHSIHEHNDTIRLCNEFLNAPENIDRSKRVQEINNALDELKDNIEKYKENIIHCKTNLERYNEAKTDLKTKLENLIVDETKLYNNFKEELDQGFVFEHSSISDKEYAEKSLKLISDEAKKKSMAEISDKLQNVFRQHSGTSISDYRPICKMIFTDSDSNDNRTRHVIELTWSGVYVDPYTFEKELKETIEHDKMLIRQEEEDMFKNILLNTISKKLYRRIDMSRKWISEMSELMQEINTSMDLTFSLSWMPRKDIGENELKFDELNKLLSKDKNLISIEDSKRMSEHFRSKIENARLSAEEAGVEINYTELVKNVMDYRNWFEFKMHYKGKGDTKSRELTNSRFNTFSGGERAMSLYIPLFAAVAAQYKKAKDTAPMIIALDEAFAGVDESNISEMFGLLEKLGFGYIINSQALWGCYETVPALEIAELCHEKDSDMVTVILYEWNGKKKTFDDRN